MAIQEQHRASYYSTVMCFLKSQGYPAIKLLFQIDLDSFM